MRRTVLLLAASGVLLAGVPVLAAGPDERATADEPAALDLLERAVRAGRSLAYTGTQYVASWHADATGASLLDVVHEPGRAVVVTAPPTAGDDEVPRTTTAALDGRHVALLAQSYDLAVAGTGRCTGRTTAVVEARRDGAVAGRFWLDRTTGLLLRREVYDEQGRSLRSSAFVDLDVKGTAGAPVGLVARPVQESAEELRGQGWQVPDSLPGGMGLFETELMTPRPGGRVLHLAYSDGLSTVSLFAQQGRLGTGPMAGFDREEVGGRPVWVRHEAPERVVWSGAGKVWTLVSDAPAPTVRAAVAALPRDPARSDGLLDRLSRGLGRIGGMLNPFG